MKKYILLFSLLINFIGFGQELKKHTVYFPSDQHTLTASEEKKLNQFISKISSETIASISLNGHTDSDASDEYNKALSERRVETVQEKISKMIKGEFVLNSEHHGEKKPIDVNTNPTGKQNNRRVEIVVHIPIQEVSVVTPLPETKPEITRDTIIRLPKGTLLIIPCAGFIKNPSCISVTEYVDGESVRSDGLTTMSSDGSLLFSGGMFDVKMCDESKCIKLLVPVRTICGRTVPFTQWTGESNNTWSENTGNPLPIKRIDNQDYYEMEVCGSGRCNLDICLPPEKKCKLFQPKTRIKLKNGYRIKTVLLSADDPMFAAYPIRTTKRKAVYYRICPCSDQYLCVEATNKNGKTEIIEYRQLDSFDKREAFGKCKENEVIKKFLFFKIRKKTMYRKYLVRKTDFKGNQ